MYERKGKSKASRCQPLYDRNFSVQPGVGVTDPIFSFIFPNFHNNQNNGCVYNITFIFDRCHHSWAAKTPGKYERGWKYLTYTCAKSKFPITEKLTNGAYRHPWRPVIHWGPPGVWLRVYDIPKWQFMWNMYRLYGHVVLFYLCSCFNGKYFLQHWSSVRQIPRSSRIAT